MNKGKENRTNKRIPVYHLAKYRLHDKPESPMIVADIKDVGEGGACLRTKEKLLVSSVLELSISFPNLPQPVYVLGRLVWVKKIKDVDLYESGIQFTIINESSRNAIAKKSALGKT